MSRDQAEGLRRLLGQQGLRIVRLNSGRSGVGKTSCAINLAAALVEKGREVLILDENEDQGNIADCLGQPAHRNFLKAVREQCELEESIQRAADISFLPAACGMAELARLPHENRLRLSDTLTACKLACDVVIIDTVAGSSSRLLPLALRDQEEILVVTDSVASITDAYAFIKGATNEYGKRSYRVLMSKVRNEQQGRAIFRNMADAARRYLGVELDLMGMIPADDAVKRAAGMGLSVLKAFPDSSAAAVFRHLGMAVAEWPRPIDGGDIAGFLHGLIRCVANQTPASGKEPSSTWCVPRGAGSVKPRASGARIALAS
ncbi:MinD/ParA family ATP-binding protein [Georgfuchsia toluolica]|nr:AAA family ATPase [Georgfuchsia toluolica]